MSSIETYVDLKLHSSHAQVLAGQSRTAGSRAYAIGTSYQLSSKPLLCDTTPDTISKSTMSNDPRSTSCPQTRYRPSVPVPAEIRNHCHIYLDEQLCECATSDDAS
jgi:hypothetical protein